MTGRVDGHCAGLDVDGVQIGVLVIGSKTGSPVTGSTC